VLPLFAFGFVVFLTWRENLRYAAMLPVMVACVIALSYGRPDVMVSPRFDLAAVIKGDMLYVSSLKKEKFIREKWESLYGFAPDTSAQWPREGQEGPLFCDELACRADIRGKHVSILKSAAVFNEECEWADVILSFDPLKGQTCGDVPVIDKFAAIDNGAYGVTVRNGQIIVSNAEQMRGARPWGSLNRDFVSDKSASATPAGPGF
jgi:hypothetical protein